MSAVADQPFVTVLTMTYNQLPKVMHLVEDLTRQTYPAALLEFVVLDDGGTDGTADALRTLAGELPYQLTVLRREHEADYLSARRWNECIIAASSREVLVQVDDVRVRQDFIERHVAWHTSGVLSLVTGAKFEGDQETWDLATCRRAHLSPDGTAQEISAWTAAWGASLSYRRELVDAVWCDPFDRPFDERMTGWGFHEVEFAYRAVRAGARVIYDPAVGVFHQNHTPSNDLGRGLDHSALQLLSTERNQAYVARKHGLAALPRW